MSTKATLGETPDRKFFIQEDCLTEEIFLDAFGARFEINSSLISTSINVKLSHDVIQKIAELYNNKKFSFQNPEPSAMNPNSDHLARES